jgi:type IV secretion system protein VirD4
LALAGTDAGIVLGRVGGDYLTFPGTEHCALYAPTRAGKGVGYVVPNCFLWPHSLVCSDIKRENYEATAGYRADLLGQDVYLFDPLAPDGRTARYNPLAYIDRTGGPDSFDSVQKVGQAFFPESTGQSKFWDDAARSAFNGACALVAETPDLPLNIATVLRLFARAEAPAFMKRLIEERRASGRPYTAACVDSISDYLTGGIELVNGIRKGVTTRLAMWNNPRIAAATEESDFDLRQLRYRAMSIYVGISPANIERLRPLLVLFWQQLIDMNVHTIPERDPLYRHPVLLNMDEFAALGALPHFATAIPYIAGYGLRAVLVVQSPAQLASPLLYGPELASVILDNCGVEAVFGTKNRAVAEDISARTGDMTVNGVTQNRPRFMGAFQWQKQTEALHPHRRPMLLPQKITRLNRRKQLIMRAGLPVIVADKLRWYKDPAFRTLRRPPPIPPEIEIPVALDDGGQILVEPMPGAAQRMQRQMGRDHTDHDQPDPERALALRGRRR